MPSGCCACCLGVARLTMFVLCLIESFVCLLGALGLMTIPATRAIPEPSGHNVAFWCACLVLLGASLLGCYASIYKRPKSLEWFSWLSLAIAFFLLIGLVRIVPVAESLGHVGQGIAMMIGFSLNIHATSSLLAYVVRRYGCQPKPASAPANSIVTQELGTNPDATNLAQPQTVHQSQPPLNPNYRPSFEAKGMLTNPSDGQQESLRYSDRPPSYNSAQ